MSPADRVDDHIDAINEFEKQFGKAEAAARCATAAITYLERAVFDYPPLALRGLQMGIAFRDGEPVAERMRDIYEDIGAYLQGHRALVVTEVEARFAPHTAVRYSLGLYLFSDWLNIEISNFFFDFVEVIELFWLDIELLCALIREQFQIVATDP